MQNFMKEVNIETEFTKLATKPTELKAVIDKANTKTAHTNKNANQKRKNNKRKASKEPEEETTFSSDKKIILPETTTYLMTGGWVNPKHNSILTTKQQ